MTHALLRTHALPTTLPRAIQRTGFRPHASANDTGALLAQLRTGFDAFQARHDGFMANTQAAVDDIYKQLGTVGAGGGGDALPVDRAYTDVFSQYFRNGQGEHDLRQANAGGERAQILAAMQTGTDSAGGYLAPIEWDKRVSAALLAQSPLRRICNVVTTGVRGFSTVWVTGGWGSGWAGEVASRPLTTTPPLASVTYVPGELYAQPAVTQQLLEDASFDVATWLASQLADTFALQEGIAFLAGSGVNQPRGILGYQTGGASDGAHPGGNLTVVPSGAASSIPADSLVDFVFGLPSPYRQNARWLMSSTTAAVLSKLKDGQGNYLWRDNYQLGQPQTLLGYPVELDENMPSAAAGNTPILFGDFKRGYTINDRTGISILRDPFSSKPHVLFYARRRVGGGITDPNALRLLKVAAS